MGNSQSAGPRGLHAPHVYAGPMGPQGPYGGPQGPYAVPPGPYGGPQHVMRHPGGPAVRWPRVEPPIQVLPQGPPPINLRNTLNGAILQQGGTISARPQNAPMTLGRRPRSSSAHRPPDEESPDLARCGSEPDLRAQMNPQRREAGRGDRNHNMTRGRKKYRAPPAPHPGSGMESSSPDLNGWEAPRKARLFKTRAETNRKSNEDALHSRLTQTLSLPRPDLREDKWQEEHKTWQRDDRMKSGRPESHEEMRSRQSRSESREEVRSKKISVNTVDSGWSGRSADKIVPQLHVTKDKRKTSSEEPIVPLQRSKSQDALSAKAQPSPDFQTELAEAAQKMRPRSALIPRQNISRSSESPERPIQQLLRSGQPAVDTAKENAQPARTFYFGMEESNKTIVKDINSNVNKTNREHRLTAVERSKNLMNKRPKKEPKDVDDETLLENFAASYHKTRQQHSVSGTSSMGSDPDPEEVEGIALQLRPTLPKKQLEIPRFSPTAAWRMLSSVDVSPAASPDSGRGMLEERILVQECAQLSLDKSADSGISGDASPGGGHESSSELIDTPPKTIHYKHQSQKSLLLAWTPEQDLEESSSEEEPPSHSKLSAVPGAKFTTRGQLFSTLPRERLDDAAQDTGSLFNSLRRPTSQPSDNNWLLSRSVPGSLNNGHATLVRSTSSPPSPEQLMDDPPAMTKYPSYSYLAQGGHVMYLPEYRSRSSVDYSPDRSPLPLSSRRSPNLSRSCEDICADMQQPLEDPWAKPSDASRAKTEQRPGKKKKFTFQSTVRLIENKRVADRLSREAELKETQRLSELEAMRRVEEEFQRKRAREKANIRHQLRLFSLEEKDFQSLPPLDWGRAEPDGAPASLPPVPRSNAAGGGGATQVLSEYRETTRDYRDYTHASRHSPDLHNLEIPPRKNFVKHPRIVADIPKNLPVYVSAQQASAVPSPRPRDNYRKEFAHGALPTSRTNSDSESQPRTRPGSRQTATRTRSMERSRSRSASPFNWESRRSSSSSSSPSTRSSSPVNTSSSNKVSISPAPLVQPWSERRSASPGVVPTEQSPVSIESLAENPVRRNYSHRQRETSPVAPPRDTLDNNYANTGFRLVHYSPKGAFDEGLIQDQADTGFKLIHSSPIDKRKDHLLIGNNPDSFLFKLTHSSANETHKEDILAGNGDKFNSGFKLIHSSPIETRKDDLLTGKNQGDSGFKLIHSSPVADDEDDLPRVVHTLPRQVRDKEMSVEERKARSRSNSPRRAGSPRNQRSRSSSPVPRSEPQTRPVPPPRIFLSAVQPFNKAGKSYRPINFTPNVAQTVT